MWLFLSQVSTPTRPRRLQFAWEWNLADNFTISVHSHSAFKPWQHHLSNLSPRTRLAVSAGENPQRQIPHWRNLHPHLSGACNTSNSVHISNNRVVSSSKHKAAVLRFLFVCCCCLFVFVFGGFFFMFSCYFGHVAFTSEDVATEMLWLSEGGGGNQVSVQCIY